MYAVIKTGGKQYKVSPGDVVAVEKLAGEPGSSITFSEVLMLGDEKSQTVGTPLVEGAAVTAEVLEQGRDGKIVVFKKKRRKGYRRLAGHRQEITTVRITDVAGKGGQKAAPKKATAKKTAAKKTAAKKDEPAADDAATEE